MNSNTLSPNARIVSTPSANNASLDTANTQLGTTQQIAPPVATLESGPENVNSFASDMGSDSLPLLGGAVASLTANTPPEDLPQGEKRNRLTKKQRDALLDLIAHDYKEGVPPTAIMLRHKLSRPQIKDFLAELFLAGAIAQKAPLFAVVEVTDTVKKQLALKEPWAWLKVEKSSDGRSYVLTEYTGA